MTRSLADDASLLVADLGGTHLRVGVRDATCHWRTSVHRWSEAPAVSTALQAALGNDRPGGVCLAVAAPVQGSRVRLTNADVDVCAETLARELDVPLVHLVNDAAALAWSVPSLGSAGVSLDGQRLRADANVVVVAPGTGLGVGCFVPGRYPTVITGEGGHIPVPSTRLSSAVTSQLLKVDGHVSAEDLVSGRGLPVLDVICRVLGGEKRPLRRAAADITGVAMGEDRPPGIHAGRMGSSVGEMFVDLLAAVTQSHALTFGATGGVLLGGGFLASLVPLLERFDFAGRFREHPKRASYLNDIPVIVDDRKHPALLGAATYLEIHR